MMSLASCTWIRNPHNVIITGPISVGKTYLACALTHKVCLEGLSAVYRRLPNLLGELAIAKEDGRYLKIMVAYARADLLTLDDWGLHKLNQEQRIDLLELLEQRYDLKSTIVTAQVPIDHWHEIIGNPTLADAIMDRLVHNAYKIQMRGDSMRKKKSTLT